MHTGFERRLKGIRTDHERIMNGYLPYVVHIVMLFSGTLTDRKREVFVHTVFLNDKVTLLTRIEARFARKYKMLQHWASEGEF